MARKITAGVVGEPSVGAIQVAPTAVITTAENQDITLDPTGTGLVVIEGDIELQAQSDLRFADADNSNYVGFQAPATVGADLTWTLPAGDGSDGTVLTTNGAGILSFTTKSIALADEAADSNPNYLLFSSTSSGDLETARVSSSNITYTPSTSALTVAGKVSSLRSENQRTANYTLALTDRDLVVSMNSASNTTITVPPNSSVAFPIGSVVYVNRIGAGTVTLTPGSGVTMSKFGTLARYEEVVIRKRATDEWIVIDGQTLSATGGTITTTGSYIVHSYTSTGSDTFTVQ